MLKRLGFKNKRKLSTGAEYYMTVKQLQELADRIGIRYDLERTQLSDVSDIRSSGIGKMNQSKN